MPLFKTYENDCLLGIFVPCQRVRNCGRRIHKTDWG
ncbi:hypothetical protein C4579_00405 [Candidatus Microgenomates bacterium]|nr:MAG: hypothetical protein C4579_00405 [Candidatus Microgenomates bacterium]